MTPRSSVRVVWLACRSLAWLCLLPGVVAGYVPWRWIGVGRVRLDARAPLHLAGLVLIAAGASLLGWCVWEFARRGRGTLAPLDPPRELVACGPYRWVRNPMYVAVAGILLGELALAPSRALLAYLALAAAAAHAFVVVGEEPVLRRRFGASYDRYAASVRRWIPAPPRDAPPG